MPEARAATRLRVALISDFFHPRVGGVEAHQYHIARWLLRRGHKVIVITGTYDEARRPGGRAQRRQGVRYLDCGLKVYYCPVTAVYSQAAIPIPGYFFPLFRDIIIREKINLVHGHQASSMLAHAGLFHAASMGICSVFTEHSLFDIVGVEYSLLNKLTMVTQQSAAHLITVSHCGKESLCLRTGVDPDRVSVIPNAVDTAHFVPRPVTAPSPTRRVNIVVISRLVYRKGVDLLTAVIPLVCAANPAIHFLIGGDGPKRHVIESMIKTHGLQDHVELLGELDPAGVHSLLLRGHIFLNCSLTEAFCIALLEAASCGLLVVSTRVGGVPEVLPPDMLCLADVTPRAVATAVARAVKRVQRDGGLDREALHRRVCDMYSWADVAWRTETAYYRAMALHESPAAPSSNSAANSTLPRWSAIGPRLTRYRAALGAAMGCFFGALAVADVALLWILRCLRPRASIDPAPDFANRFARMATSGCESGAARSAPPSPQLERERPRAAGGRRARDPPRARRKRALESPSLTARDASTDDLRASGVRQRVKTRRLARGGAAVRQ